MTLHQRRQLNRASRIFVVALVICAFSISAGWAQNSWRIYLDDADITGPAAPIGYDDAPAVNVCALGSALGLATSISGNELLLTDANGTQWRARGGDGSLESTEKSLILDHPTLIQSATVYIPIKAIAEITGLRLKVDRDARRADLQSSQNQPTALADGWQTMNIEKTPQELGLQTPVQKSLGANHNAVARLPSDHSTLRLSLGQGYSKGANSATELKASGEIRGIHIDFGTFLTTGDQGLKLSSGRLALVDDEYGRGLEAGDLSSELGGLERGLRYSWRVSENRWPSISIYLRSESSGSHGTLLAYRDTIALNRQISVGGEVASNGALLLTGRFAKDRLQLYGYHRSTSGSSGGGTGFFASFDLGRGISLYGDISRSGVGDDRQDCSSLSVRLPILSGMDLTLQHTILETVKTSSNSDAAMLTLPLGPVRLLLRHQWRSSARPSSSVMPGWLGSNSRELMASAAYNANSRLSFDYQLSSYWQDGSNSGKWEQLVSTYRLSPRTQLQTISGFPNMMEPDQLRLRLTQELQRDCSMNLEYGRLTGNGIDSGERGFKISVRKQWSLATPVRGGEVSGRVVDLLNLPIPNAVVQLGAYRAVADDKGRYAFRHIPPGSYEMYLDKESLPVDYNDEGMRKSIITTSASREKIDLRAIPLNTITGRAYCDQNGNGEYDPGEGTAGLVIRIAEFATVTGSDGSFGFYNLEPGSHAVSLDTARLLTGLVPGSPTEVTVDLLPDKSVSGITFRLLKQEKEIEFQAL